MTSSPPVICQLLHGLEVGGAEVLAFRLARKLQGQFRFVFACLDHVGSLGRELATEGFPVHCLDRREGLDLRCVRRMRRLVRAERIDLIHAHQYTPFSYACLSRQFLGKPVPVLFTEHGRHFPDLPSRKRKLANRWLLEGGDRVVGVGEAVRQALIHNEGFPPDRVGVIHNGIPLENFDGVHRADAEALRRGLGLPADSLVLIQVARLDYLKDHLTALRMMRRLIGDIPRARLLLVGEGPERPKIESHVAELGLSRHVLLLGQRGDIPQLLSASDIVLLTSISEGIPLTLIEAMANGLPVVATDVGGVGEVVAAGITGQLAASGDDLGLARLVGDLAADPGSRRRMGQLGQARAHALFSERRMHAAYVELFEKMLRPSSSAMPSTGLSVTSTSSSRVPRTVADAPSSCEPATLGKGV